MSKRVVVVGGFTENISGVERMGDALINPAGSPFDNFDAFVFRESEDDPKLLRAARGNTVVTHSAGLMWIPGNTEAARVVSLSGPEKRSITKLAHSVAKKVGNHLVGIVSGDQPVNRLRVLGMNTLEVTNPWTTYRNLRYLREISDFSTVDRLTDIKNCGAAAVSMVCNLSDELYPPDFEILSKALRKKIDIRSIEEGGHDWPFVYPEKILELVAA